MWFVNIVVLLFVAFLLSYLFKEDVCDTLPIATGVLILVLYIMAFLRCLNGIDIISIAFLLFLCLFLLLLKKERRSDFLRTFLNTFAHPQTIIFLFFTVILFLFVKDQIALWWDDINYWASDVKGLYYLNGFAGKYGNVSPEFGDYPPAVQLFKWWFLHFNPETFKEGYMFAGYYILNLIFLLPLLRRLKTRNILIQIVSFAALFLLPGVINGIYFTGTCSDITMGIVYGAVLWAVWDYKGHTSLFYYLRLTVYLSVLVLTKSVGIEWVCFGILFFLFFYRKWKMQEEIQFQKGNGVKIILMIGLPVLTEISWLLFCLLNRRVAKLTSAGVHMAVGGKYTIPDNALEKMDYFIKGLLFYPMHADKTWMLDLSMMMLILIFTLFLVLAGYKKILQTYEMKRILMFMFITAVASIGIIFIAHITIFSGELQYLDAGVMAISIARYGAPFSLGMLYLLFGILLTRIPVKRAYILFIVFILLTTNYPRAYNTLYGYRKSLKQNQTERSEMVDEHAKRFLTVTDKEKRLWGKRVLYLRDDNTIHWVKDTYVSYAASPTAVVYGGVAIDKMSKEDIITKIRDSHASYLYVDEVDGNPGLLFDEFLTNQKFEYDTLYSITLKQNGIILEKMKGYN